MFLPGELSFHSSLPVFLSSAMKLGASGLGMLMWPSSTPLAVTTNTMSPTISGGHVGQVVREHVQFLDHVQRPDDVRVGRRPCTSRPGTPGCRRRTRSASSADHLGPVADVVDAVAVDRRASRQTPSFGQSLTLPASSLSWTACQRNLPVRSSKHISTPRSIGSTSPSACTVVSRLLRGRSLLVPTKISPAGDDRLRVATASRGRPSTGRPRRSRGRTRRGCCGR